MASAWGGGGFAADVKDDNLKAPTPIPDRDPARPESCGGIFTTLCRILSIIFNRRKTGDQCLYFPERVINRPDPCIYSQFLLMQLNQPVTWDNPDIALLRGGVEVATFDLDVDTEYEVAIRVHNSSTEKPANGTRVHVRWVEFGAGGQIRHPVADLIANVPVWPATTIVTTTWRTPAAPGHYCIEVELVHQNDGNPANNRGWNNTQVKTAASSVEVPIRIFNRWLDQTSPAVAAGTLRGEQPAIPANLVELAVDSYRFRDGYGREAEPAAMFAPRPPAWPIRLEPRTFHFGPTDTFRDVVLVVEAPDRPGEPETFNVTARQGGGAAGGVTVRVTRGG